MAVFALTITASKPVSIMPRSKAGIHKSKSFLFAADYTIQHWPQCESDRIVIMSSANTVTRKDIDDVLNVLDTMMTRIDDRFTKVESSLVETQKIVTNIQNQLDNIEKRIEISEDERLVMAHQLTQLHDWVEKAAKRINVDFAH